MCAVLSEDRSHYNKSSPLIIIHHRRSLKALLCLALARGNTSIGGPVTTAIITQ